MLLSAETHRSRPVPMSARAGDEHVAHPFADAAATPRMNWLDVAFAPTNDAACRLTKPRSRLSGSGVAASNHPATEIHAGIDRHRTSGSLVLRRDLTVRSVAVVLLIGLTIVVSATRGALLSRTSSPRSTSLPAPCCGPTSGRGPARPTWGAPISTSASAPWSLCSTGAAVGRSPEVQYKVFHVVLWGLAGRGRAGRSRAESVEPAAGRALRGRGLRGQPVRRRRRQPARGAPSLRVPAVDAGRAGAGRARLSLAEMAGGIRPGLLRHQRHERGRGADLPAADVPIVAVAVGRSTGLAGWPCSVSCRSAGRSSQASRCAGWCPPSRRPPRPPNHGRVGDHRRNRAGLVLGRGPTPDGDVVAVRIRSRHGPGGPASRRTWRIHGRPRHAGVARGCLLSLVVAPSVLRRAAAWTIGVGAVVLVGFFPGTVSTPLAALVDWVSNDPALGGLPQDEQGRFDRGPRVRAAPRQCPPAHCDDAASLSSADAARSTAAAAIASVAVWVMPAVSGNLYPSPIDVPSYWQDAATAVDARGDDSLSCASLDRCGVGTGVPASGGRVSNPYEWDAVIPTRRRRSAPGVNFLAVFADLVVSVRPGATTFSTMARYLFSGRDPALRPHPPGEQNGPRPAATRAARSRLRLVGPANYGRPGENVVGPVVASPFETHLPPFQHLGVREVTSP